MPTVTFPQSRDLITPRPRRSTVGPYTLWLALLAIVHSVSRLFTTILFKVFSVFDRNLGRMVIRKIRPTTILGPKPYRDPYCDVLPDVSSDAT